MDKDGFSIKLGEKIKKLRKNKGLSQEELSEKINKSPDTISNIERGIFPPRLDTALEISKALNVPLHELFHVNEQSPKDKLRANLIEEINELLKDQPNAVLDLMLEQTKQLIALKEKLSTPKS